MRYRKLDHFASKMTKIAIVKEIQTLIVNCYSQPIFDFKVPKEELWLALWLSFAVLIKIVSFRGMAERWKSGYFSVMKYFGFITLTPSVSFIFQILFAMSLVNHEPLTKGDYTYPQWSNGNKSKQRNVYPKKNKLISIF